MQNATQPVFRFRKELGVFVIDRSIESCRFKTEYCDKHCYNMKFYKRYNTLEKADVENEESWRKLSGKSVKAGLDRKRLSTKRLRLASRGECLRVKSDVFKVADIAKENHGRVVSVFTRAWRNGYMRKLIEKELFPINNLRVIASLDPTNTDDEFKSLDKAGWSTSFFGDDSKTDGRFKCPKTWKHLKGFCAKCKNGCFSDKQVHIHLKQH